jgi:hypothetical protein
MQLWGGFSTTAPPMMGKKLGCGWNEGINGCVEYWRKHNGGKWKMMPFCIGCLKGKLALAFYEDFGST